MATTTTNFGWTIPQSTDLVKDGATAISTLGSGIDTSMMDLKGGTTGQMLTKNSNTDMDFVWATPNPGDITGVTAGTGLSGGGTSGDVTLSIDSTVTTLTGTQTLTNKTLTSPVLTTPSISTIDAKGDLLVGTADNTIGRLAVGTDGQVLTADSTTSTGTKWATAASGGLTLLSTTSISGASTTISSISGSYKHLQIILDGLTDSSGDSYYMRLNGDSGTKYWWNGYYSRDDNGTIGLVTYNSGRAGTTRALIIYQNGTGSTAERKGRGVINIYRYTDTTGVFFDVDTNSQDSIRSFSEHIGGVYTNSAAITSVTIGINSGSISGGTAYIYGVN